MAAEIGNKIAVKLTSPELKKEAYEEYCKHVAAGHSKDTWYFKDEDRLLCTFETIEKYMKEEPDVFPPIKMNISKCKSKGIWEGKGLEMMEGKKRCEPAIYQMFMRNKFGWDKPEKNVNVEETKTDLKTYTDDVKAQREQLQAQAQDRNE